MKIINNVNFNKKQLKNAVVENLGTAPSNPIDGQVYFNDGTVIVGNKGFYIFQGTVWKKLTDQTMTASQINTALGTLTSGEIDFNTTLNMNNKSIIGVAMPTTAADSDAANRKFVVDSVNNGIKSLDLKEAVRAVMNVPTNFASYDATVNLKGLLTLSGDNTSNLTKFDDVLLSVGDRVIIAATQSSAWDGFYKVLEISPNMVFERVDLLHGDSFTPNRTAHAFVLEGTKYRDTGWVLNEPNHSSGVVGITPCNFIEHTSPRVSTGLTKTDNTLSVDTSVIATRQFVTDSITGLDVKQSVKAATIANFAISTTPQGKIITSQTPPQLQTAFDGILISQNDRVLVKNRSITQDNGLYRVEIVNGDVELVRVDLLHGQPIQANAFVFVEQGTTLKDTGWVLSSNSGTVGTDDIVFTQFSAAGVATYGFGLSKSSGNVVSVDTTVIARKFSTTIGNNLSTVINVTHLLNSEDVVVMVRENSGDKNIVLADVKITDGMTVTLTFDTPPTTDQYRVTVIS